MEDDKIIDLYWKRMEVAIEETSLKYGSYCRTIAYNILSNHEDAEESENDTYTALWKTIPPKRPVNLKAFIGRVVRNLSLTKYDYNVARKRNSSFTVILSELEECLAATETVESQYEKGEIVKYISEFLRTLKKEQRQMFVRRYWYSDSIATIATQFGMSESKVKSMLFRIRGRLRLYLEGKGVWL